MPDPQPQTAGQTTGADTDGGTGAPAAKTREERVRAFLANIVNRLSPAALVTLYIACAAGAVALLALLLSATTGVEVWAPVMSLAVWAAVLLGLFAVGPTHWTVWNAFTVGEGATAVTYAPGAVVTEADYDKLAENKTNVRRQRGLYLRALYVGADGRWSTSKTQALLWTFTVLWALLAIFLAFQFGTGFEITPQGAKKSISSFGDLPFDDSYLVLLGGYFAAGVLAKGITTSKVGQGDVKPPAEEAHSTLQGIKDLATDDNGQADLGDTQFFLFNLLALAVFYVSFLGHIDQGLPSLPGFLVGLTSVSAGAYVAKKAIASSTPAISAVSPKNVRRGDMLRIDGSYLVTSPNIKPQVTVGGAAVAEDGIEMLSPSGTVGATSAIRVEVPEQASGGEDQSVEVTPVGATAPATATVTIVVADVTSTDPSPIEWRAGAPVVINGSGFGPDPGKPRRVVKIGEQRLDVISWSDTRIAATLPDDLTGAPPKDSLALEIAAGADERFDGAVAVAQTKPTISGVTPPIVPLKAGTEVTLTGSNFGSSAGKVTLEGAELTLRTWSDTQIVAELTSPPAMNANARMTLRVHRDGYEDGEWTLPVTV